MNEVLLELHGGRRDGIRIIHDRKVEVSIWIAFPVDIGVYTAAPEDPAERQRLADRYRLAAVRAGVVRYDWKERREVPVRQLITATADKII